MLEKDGMDRERRALAGDGDELGPGLEELLALTAHELHEPLRKIQTFGELLRAHAGPALDEESLDYVARMERAADRMRGTLAKVIAYARVPRGLPLVVIDLGEAAAGAVEKLTEPIAEVKASVEISPLPQIHGDPFQVQQLFEHLVDNAIKFRREGVAPLVRIEAAASPEPAWCAVRIADNGIGFDDAFAERIFLPFERLHGRGKYPGAGMGLPICRRIAHRHGGRIEARGVPGEGAVFTLHFPAANTT